MCALLRYWLICRRTNVFNKSQFHHILFLERFSTNNIKHKKLRLNESKNISLKIYLLIIKTH